MRTPGTTAAVGAATAAIAANLNVFTQIFGGDGAIGGGGPRCALGSLPPPLGRVPGPRPPCTGVPTPKVSRFCF
jgi:hypothetical protein